MELTRSLTVFLVLLVLVGTARLVELSISRRRQRALRASGVAPVPEPHFRAMVSLHTAILIGAGLEAWLLRRQPLGLLSVVAVLVFLGANALRIWVIASLGRHWNVQIMDSTALGVVTNGPFRFIRHPNYVAVFAELAALPLIHGAWLTSLLGSAAHVWVLFHRVRTEEAALLAHPQYLALMGPKPRFFPGARSLLPARIRRLA